MYGKRSTHRHSPSSSRPRSSSRSFRSLQLKVMSIKCVLYKMSSFGLKSSIVNQKYFFPVLSFPVHFWTGLCFPCATLRHNPIQLYHFPDASHFKGNTQCYRLITCCLVMQYCLNLYSRPRLGLPVCRWVRLDRVHQCHPEHQEHPRIQCLLGHPDQNTVMQRVSKHSSDHTTMITA